nr:hypothetical protein [Pyrococcus abyssi]
MAIRFLVNNRLLSGYNFSSIGKLVSYGGKKIFEVSLPDRFVPEIQGGTVKILYAEFGSAGLYNLPVASVRKGWQLLESEGIQMSSIARHLTILELIRYQQENLVGATPLVLIPASISGNVQKLADMRVENLDAKIWEFQKEVSQKLINKIDVCFKEKIEKIWEVLPEYINHLTSLESEVRIAYEVAKMGYEVVLNMGKGPDMYVNGVPVEVKQANTFDLDWKKAMRKIRREFKQGKIVIFDVTRTALGTSLLVLLFKEFSWFENVFKHAYSLVVKEDKWVGILYTRPPNQRSVGKILLVAP